MKKIVMNKIDETIYYEKLENGMDVYLYSKDNWNNNYVTFTTKFGSIYNEFVPIDKDKMIKVPYGVAHFLEHKVFAQKEDPQPETFFASSGTICNAYTTFKNTTYLFSGPNELKKNINYLLDYVQSPYFTEDNVESEKGIITQEIHMCDDNISDVMYEHIRKNIFHNNNFKDSVIGTVQDINKITKDTLYTCYNTFYHPSNMFLVVCGNFNKEEILNAIIENQSHKKFKEFKKIELKEYKEPDKVVKKEETIYLDTVIPKVSYNIKIANKTSLPTRVFNLYLFIIFSILFDDSSEFDNICKSENIITNSLYFNLLNCDTHMLLSLINETNQYNKLLEKIKDELKDITIKECDLERKKKVLISNEIFSFENLEIINDMIVDNIIFENKIEEDVISMIENLNMEDLDKVIKSLDLSNTSTIIIKKK